MALVQLTLILVIACLSGCTPVPAETAGPTLIPVTIKDETFRLELSADPETREQGLMYRTEIPADGGMLFVFPDVDMRSFWMANCLVDMDLIFLDPRGRVTALHEMKTLPPRGPDESAAEYDWRCHLAACGSRFPAQFAIELKSGSIARLGLAVEDRIELDLEHLKALAR